MGGGVKGGGTGREKGEKGRERGERGRRVNLEGGGEEGGRGSLMSVPMWKQHSIEMFPLAAQNSGLYESCEYLRKTYHVQNWI